MGDRRVYKAKDGLRVVEATDLAAWAKRHPDRLSPEQREHLKGDIERLTDLGLDHKAAMRLLRHVRKGEHEEREDPEARRLRAVG